MSLVTDIATLKAWPQQLTGYGVAWLERTTHGFFILDLIYLGALKRTLSLVSGMNAMIENRNMVCARALLRMNLDTLSRVRAYMYVDNPEGMAKAVLQGSRLDSFKSTAGEQLRDSYLVDRLSLEAPWVNDVYRSTSGYIHFSERQFFDSIQTVDEHGLGSFTLAIGDEDHKYPEASWIEVTSCFNSVTHLTVQTLRAYFERSAA